MFEKTVKIPKDEDFKALIRKNLPDKDIQWIVSELVLRLEAICGKLRDGYLKILIGELYNKIKQDKDFKKRMQRYEVKNEKQFIFEGLLYHNVRK